MKIYLDNCCYNRPFDDQQNMKIFLETQAKLHIQQKIKDGQYLLVWSYVLEYENRKILMNQGETQYFRGKMLRLKIFMKMRKSFLLLRD